MNVVWNIKYSPQPPCVVSHYMHGDIRRMKQNIENAGKAHISVTQRTKTTVNIHVWFDNDCFTIAYIPKGAEKLKFVEASQYSFFDCESSTRQYFRVSKKQNLPELKEYLGLVLRDMKLSIETIVVDMNIIGVESLKS